MGVLDNTTITVDAILTKKGRELLAQGDGKFKITQFALADDEIDYGLYDITHPNGSNFYGAAIENMNLLEAIPNQTLAVKYFLTDTTGDGTTTAVIEITGPGTIKGGNSGTYVGTTSGYAGELYDWTLENTTYATIASTDRTAAQQAADTAAGVASQTGGGGNTGASTSSAVGNSITIRVKSDAILGGQDRQVVLRAVGQQSGAPKATTINLVRN